MTSNTGGDTASASVKVEEHGAHAVIRIDRAAQRNSLSADTLTNIDRAFATLAARERIASVIFTGTGDVFASGADIRELEALTSESARVSAREFAERGQRLFQSIADAPKLSIAAVNGFCMGGGLDLALACRVRVASHAALFAHPGARLGIITGWGGTQRLTRLIGTARALEIFVTARRIDAEEAFSIGLVTRLHQDALACALEIASHSIVH